MWTQTCTWAEHHGKIKAEIGAMLLQAKGHQKLGSMTRSQERGPEQLLSGSPQKESNLPVLSS